MTEEPQRSNGDGGPRPSDADGLFRTLLRGAKEAKGWLMESPQNRSIGEGIGASEATRLVDQLYSMGAISVYAAEIDEYDDQQNTGTFVVELPSEPGARQKLFEYESHVAEQQGFDGEADRGQRYLMLRFD